MDVIAIGICGVVFFGIINAVAAAMMTIQVNEIVPESERFSWWGPGSRDVGRRFRELFPDSLLPTVAACSFWVCVTLLTGMIIISVLGRH
jgi:hypothetical protein